MAGKFPLCYRTSWARRRRCRAKYGCNVVLKSAVTVMLTADGQQCALNAVGSPALAKGGSGDALAGILGIAPGAGSAHV